jgi:hypothetical protein
MYIVGDGSKGEMVLAVMLYTILLLLISSLLTDVVVLEESSRFSVIRVEIGGFFGRYRGKAPVGDLRNHHWY